MEVGNQQDKSGSATRQTTEKLMLLEGSLRCVGELECSSHSFNYYFSSLSVVPIHHDFLVFSIALGLP